MSIELSILSAIELDGAVHLFPQQMDYDIKRQQIIEKTGIRILRFTNTEIEYKLDLVLEKISMNLPFSLLVNKR